MLVPQPPTTVKPGAPSVYLPPPRARRSRVASRCSNHPSTGSPAKPFAEEEPAPPPAITAQQQTRRNVMHHSKSSKLAASAVAQMTSGNNALELPAIAKNPFGCLRQQCIAKRLPLNLPYVVDDNSERIFLEMLAAAARKPLIRRQDHCRYTMERHGTAKLLLRGENAPPVAAPAAEACAMDSEACSVTPNELTLTYMRVLAHSEDFARRAVLRSESRAADQLTKQCNRLREVVHSVLGQFRAIVEEEQSRRDVVVDDEQRSRGRVEALSTRNAEAAKRHEDVRPTCLVLGKHQSVHIDPFHCEGLVVEVRWRGGVELSIHALVFDDEKCFAYASATSTLR